jgi:hypothetical protein
VGWRKFWWLNVAILAFNTVNLVFLFLEIKWHRLHPTELVSTITPRSDGESTDKGNAPADNTHEIEAALADANAPFPNFEPDTAHQDALLGKGRPSKAQFKFHQPADAIHLGSLSSSLHGSFSLPS